MATKNLKETENQPKNEQYIPTPEDLILPDGKILIDGNKRVPLKVPRIPGQKDQPDVVISINGYNTQIKRGVEVMVPQAVKEVYDQSVKQAEDADAFLYSHVMDD